MGERNNRGKKVAQRKPLTKAVNKQVATTEVLGETSNSPVKKENKEESKLSFTFSVFEILLSICAYVGIALVPGLSVLAAFTYISSALISSLKEFLKDGVEKLVLIFNTITIVVIGIVMILLFIIVKCTPTGTLLTGLEIAIKVMIGIVPGRLMMYITLYLTKIFKKK